MRDNLRESLGRICIICEWDVVGVRSIGVEDLGNFQISVIGDCMKTNAIHCDRGITDSEKTFLDILYLRDPGDIKGIISTLC